MTLKIACSNCRFVWYFVRNGGICVLVKARITRKSINLPTSLFVNYVRASSGTIAISYLVKKN